MTLLAPTHKEPRGFLTILRVIFESVWHLHHREALIIVLCAVASGALQSYTPQVLQQIIDGFTAAAFSSPEGGARFRSLLLYFVLAGVGGLFFKLVAEKTAFYLATRVEDYWRFTVLRKYYDLPISWHDAQDSGEVASRIDRGGSAMRRRVDSF